MKVKNLLAVALVAAAISSCSNYKPASTVLNNKIDTVSYAIGMARSNGFLPYLQNQMGVDSAYMADFWRGFFEGAAKSSDMALNAYMAGLQIGMSEGEQTVNSISMELFGESSDLSLNRDNYLNGFVDGTNLNDKIMSREVASETAERLFDEIHAESMELEYGDNKAAGQIFLEEKAKEEGIIATGSGLLYKVIKKGKGKIPTIDQRVTVKYKGSLIDGTVFDESTTGIELSVGNVIEGWQEALQMMPVGSKWELYIPYELGYGERAAGADIKPYSALIFEVELVSIL